MIVGNFFRNFGRSSPESILFARGGKKNYDAGATTSAVTVAWDVIRTLNVIILNSKRTEHSHRLPLIGARLVQENLRRSLYAPTAL